VSGNLIQGNSTQIPLKNESVQLCCFSPPYWNLRSYKIKDIQFPDGWSGQLGLEPSIDLFLDHMILVMDEVWRILRDDGVCFVNIGDTLRAKSLCLVPQKFAIRCQEAGWIVRSEIIWHKLNPMPESCRDRPTKAHEQVWMLTKQGKYFWDQEGVKEKNTSFAGNRKYFRGYGDYTTQSENQAKKGLKRGGNKIPGNDGMPRKRNIRSVWTLATEPTPEAHFATWPSRLAEKMIRAGSSPRACEICGAPWERIIKYKANYEKREMAHQPGNTPTKVDSTGWRPPTIQKLGWRSTCGCDGKGTGKCVIADIFAGVGTTVLVAEKLGRIGIGIDLSAEYLWNIAKKKINAPMQRELF